jgi:hypothetical protein
MAKKETLTSEDIDKALAESMLTEEFDVKAASDTEGFLEFLALFDDSKNGEHDPAAMQERFEIFKMKNEIVEDIKDIWHNEISDEIGIELSEEELGFVNEYLEGEAVENPMRLKQMKEQVANYYELPKLIESTNKDLMDLTTTAETAIKGTGILGSIRMYGGLALTEITGKTNTGTESYHAQRSMMEQAGIPANRRSLEARRVDLGSNAEEIQGEFAQLQSVKLEALEGLSNKLATIKQELFSTRDCERISHCLLVKSSRPSLLRWLERVDFQL